MIKLLQAIGVAILFWLAWGFLIVRAEVVSVYWRIKRWLT